MNIDQKLTAIRDIIQQDVGNRGLARDPHDNLLTATRGDFTEACASIAHHLNPAVEIFTGFYIPSAQPPAFETDGPLGALFLARGFFHLGVRFVVVANLPCLISIQEGASAANLGLLDLERMSHFNGEFVGLNFGPTERVDDNNRSHRLVIERPGPASDGKYYSMRGFNLSPHAFFDLELLERTRATTTIGIGDGGNEIGMGKIPHETIVKNIPNGDLIHCRVPTDHLIVAGVSNWGAYGLAAGVALLRGVKLPDELFDPDREREILQIMVDAGPLVDGVTGKQTTTVDGLSWEDYIKPLVEIGKIMRD